jgi:hypothetical protein
MAVFPVSVITTSRIGSVRSFLELMQYWRNASVECQYGEAIVADK